MSEKKPINASTMARLAGNIASGMIANPNGFDPRMPDDQHSIAHCAVEIARCIVAEVERTEPATERQETPK